MDPDSRTCEFVEDTISFFKMDINPAKWNEKNISDWFYWIRHKLRFNFPKIKKDVFDLTNPGAAEEKIWIDTFGEMPGLAMCKEFRGWLAYRDFKLRKERLNAENQIKMKSPEELLYVEKRFNEDQMSHSLSKRNYENSILRPRRRNEKKEGLYLWQILLRLLLDPAYIHIISWTDCHNGKFKILNPEEVSKIWGDSKNNPNMTYDKMSRSMRQYYKSKLLIKTNRDKLNYCFNMNDTSVKKFTNRCLQKMPMIKRPVPSQLYPEL